MNVKQLLAKTYDEVNRMTTAELREALRAVADANNKAIRRMQERGIVSEALIARAKRVGAVTGKGKNTVYHTDSPALLFKRPRGSKQTRSSMMAQLKDAISYAQTETGSLRKLTISEKRFEEKVPGISEYIGYGGDKKQKTTAKRFWNLYHKFKEENPQAAEKGGTDDYLRAAVEIFSGKKNISLRTFLQKMGEAEKRIYELEAEVEDSEFFAI